MEEARELASVLARLAAIFEAFNLDCIDLVVLGFYDVAAAMTAFGSEIWADSPFLPTSLPKDLSILLRKASTIAALGPKTDVSLEIS